MNTLFRAHGSLWTLERQFLALISFPIAIFLAGEIAVAQFAAYPTEIKDLLPAENMSLVSTLSEAAFRLRMLGLFLLLVVGTSAIIARFEIERRILFETRSRRNMLIGAGICVLVGVSIVFLSEMKIFIPRSFDVLGADIFTTAFKLSAKFPNALSEDTFRTLMNADGLLVGVAVASLIMSAISTLATCESSDLEDRKAHWRFQTERLQLITYISTALLVAGLLYIQSWAQWPTFVLDPKVPNPSAIAYSGIVNSYLAYTGIQYSLLLASFVVPVTALLNRKADLLALASLKGKAAKKSRTKAKTTMAAVKYSAATISAERAAEKLAIQFIDQLKAIAAVLAPFVAGSLGNIVTLLSAKS